MYKVPYPPFGEGEYQGYGVEYQVGKKIKKEWGRGGEGRVGGSNIPSSPPFNIELGKEGGGNRELQRIIYMIDNFIKKLIPNFGWILSSFSLQKVSKLLLGKFIFIGKLQNKKNKPLKKLKIFNCKRFDKFKYKKLIH